MKSERRRRPGADRGSISGDFVDWGSLRDERHPTLAAINRYVKFATRRVVQMPGGLSAAVIGRQTGPIEITRRVLSFRGAVVAMRRAGLDESLSPSAGACATALATS